MKYKWTKGVKACFVVFLACSMMLSVSVYGVERVSPSDNASGIYTVAGNNENVPTILGESAIVVDVATGYTLYEKNIYDKHYPASITKIMTALLTLEQADLNETVTFSYEAVFSVEAGSSAAYVDVDEQLTVEQCLYGLMLISGNDLANGLAEHVGGTMSNFATMMTNRAKELGCVNTNFANAHGLHDTNHYTCAYDMAKIALEAYDTQEKFMEICSTLTYECPPTNKQSETRVWGNKNRLINPYEEVYYEDCIGGKTGYTNEAGGTLVTYAKINGRTLLCVIMKSTHSAAAFADTTALYEYVRNNVTAEMYNQMDEQYNALVAEENNQQGENTEQPSTEIKDSTQNNTSGTDASDNEEEDGGLWIGWKIIILLVTIFIIYYAYVRYMRYQRMKKRRERRMRERRQQQRPPQSQQHRQRYRR